MLKNVDKKLQNPAYRQIIFGVLDHYGYEWNLASFEELDGWLDWEAVHRSINRPFFSARVWRLCTYGKFAPEGSRVGTTVVDLRGATRDEALDNLDRKSFEFIEWW